MSLSNEPTPKEAKPLVVENWPMNLDATRQQLKKAHKRLKQYQAALRLANVEIERRNRGIVALTTFTYQANRMPNPAALFKLALVQALETTSAVMGATVLINTETKELNLGVRKGLTPKLSQILIGQELGYGAIALMPHLVAGSGALLEYENTEDEEEQQLLKASGLTSLVSLPLQLGPRLMGAFLVGLEGERTFTPAELCFLMALSQETAITLEGLRVREGLWHTAEALLGDEISSLDLQTLDKADLEVDIPTPFDLPGTGTSSPEPAEDDLEHLLAAMMEAEDEVQQQNADLRTLNTITEMMNRTLSLKEILQCAVDQTRETVNTDAAWLYLLDDQQRLAMSAHTGLSKSYVQAMGRLGLKDGVEGLAVTNDKPYFITSFREENQPHKIWVDKEGIHGLAAVPITRPDNTAETGQNGTHVIGVLVTGTIGQGVHTWSPREMRLLGSIANQVALAIDNAQLHEKLQEAEISLRVGNEVLRTVNDMLLEKNAFLEGYIQEDLAPTLIEAIPILQNLLAENPDALTEKQKQDVAALQEAVSRLSKLAQEASEVSEVLDTEFDKVLDHEGKGFAGPTKPLRLEKKRNQETEALDDTAPLSSPPPDRKIDARPDAATNEPRGEVDTKPMSFEEAVAAGLVPGQIVNRETDSS